MTKTKATPLEVDEALAEQHETLFRVNARLKGATETAQAICGDSKSNGFGGRTYLTTNEEAWARVERSAVTDDPYNAMYGRRPSDLIAVRAKLLSERDAILNNIYKLDAQYTGWSRFFVVTSSNGHVHSSMQCHTCRPTTRFGWLPRLSGKSEAEAVAELGPNLCTVCFESAPVEHKGGKITKAKAEKLTAQQAK
jgi:hypothetical protein